MTADQFKAIQATLGCKGHELAGWLETTAETVSRWRHGQPIPGPAAAAMRALADGWRPSV